MKKHQLLLIAILTLELLVITRQQTSALYSDTGSSTANTFTAADVFPSPTPTITPTPTPTLTPTITPMPSDTPTPTPGVLVINEVFESSTSTEEWVEIFNGTSGPIDVSGWTIEDALATSDVLPTVSPIPAGGYGVIVANAATSVPVSAIKIDISSPIGGGLNDPGDLVRLKNTSAVTVDQMSYGTNTTVFPTPPSAPGTGQSLARIPNGVDTDTGADWALDSSPTIGEVNIP